jgi:hypothetical protein
MPHNDVSAYTSVLVTLPLDLKVAVDFTAIEVRLSTGQSNEANLIQPADVTPWGFFF